ncbi:putative multiple-sugar transport system permease YteP [Spirochaetia bacterium]|nr:putative multiple-sugar transport system permease YteP [Spirochaetia bacterium]
MKDQSKSKRGGASTFQQIRKNYDIYLLLIPGLIFIILIRYMPMYGLITAFQDYNIYRGITESPFVGFKHFQALFGSPKFYEVLANTLIISFGKIAVSFPLSILIALMINEIRLVICKRLFQTLLYLPHFLSWVIVSGLVIAACSPSSGMINEMIKGLGGHTIAFLMDNNWFRWVIILSETWKESGYGAIVFIAALSGINQELYEAASVDGAGKLKQIIHITLPGIMSVIILMFVLKLGGILNANTEQVLLLYNPTVYQKGDVLGTYIYRTGVALSNYSYATALGFFESLVGMGLVLIGNTLSRRTYGRSVW